MAGRAVLNHVFPAMRLVNLTGYCINVEDHRGPIVRIVKPSDERAYLQGGVEPFEIGTVGVDRVKPRRVVGLLPQKEDVLLYIVNPDGTRASNRMPSLRRS